MTQLRGPFRADPDVIPAPLARGHGAIVALVDPAGRILLQQRDDPVPPEGYGRWAIPGGRIEPGETPREAARREFEEETSVVLEGVRYFASFVESNDAGEFGVHLFFAHADVPEAAIDVREGLAFRYWSPWEAAVLRMNPTARTLLGAFTGSDQYRGLIARQAAPAAAVSVIALDRWGRALMQLRDRDLPAELHPATWTLPGGAVEVDESPDAAALREFEEETGQLLTELRFFRTFRRETELPAARVPLVHVYYGDPDLDLELLEVNEGEALAYVGPGELAGLPVTPWTGPVLEAFFASTAYRALFH